MRDYTGPQDIADCQNDKHMAGVEELKEGSSSIFHATNWASWNPAALKTPKAFKLSKTQVTKPETVTKPEENSEIPTKLPLEDVAGPSSGRKMLSVRTPMNQKGPSISGMKKKTALTTDCRIKINVLSEAKLELINIQKECLKRELIIKDKEHALKMEHNKEEHEIKMKKHKIELEILELELKNKKGFSFLIKK
ncbi:hypothetical protein JTB14_022767 [Gonioctena quinquepunctata]|nr:hypothetical protein JTB14_022767 [Gonioctena quinquepunctata]